METCSEGRLSMFFPKVQQREYYIQKESDLILGKTIVRYKNGKTKCYVEEKTDNGKYRLWDGSGTKLCNRYHTFEELQDQCVIVRYLDIEQPYVVRDINKIEECKWKLPDDDYRYYEHQTLMQNKHTGEFAQYECACLKRNYEDLNDITDESFVTLNKPTWQDPTIRMKNEDIINDWQIVVMPTYKTVDREKE